MKTKFLAGLIATIVSLIVVISLALFLALVIDVNPKKNWFTTTAAFLTIGTWLAIYKWLKPTPPTLDSWGNVVEKKVNQIDSTAFKAAYSRNPRILIRVGIFLAVTCLPGAVCLLIFSNDPSDLSILIGFSILFIFGGFGVFFILKGVKVSNAINNGTEHLMNAIESNDSEHVVWFYGVATDIQGSLKGSKIYQIVIFSKGRTKPALLGVKNEQTYDEILAFLNLKFPDAVKETSKLIRQDMRAEYGFKGGR